MDMILLKDALLVIVPLVSLGIAWSGLRRGKLQDGAERAAQTAQLTAELGAVRGAVESMSAQLERLGIQTSAQYTALLERVAKLEASASSAHKRIDSLGARE
jgi:hypothetical protein